MSQAAQESFNIVSAVPKGKVASYGTIGRVMSHRVSGLIIGNWLDKCPSGVPWWRIVGADGSLKIHKKSPELAHEQMMKLESEGVAFFESIIQKEFFIDEYLLAELFATQSGSKLPADG